MSTNSNKKVIGPQLFSMYNYIKNYFGIGDSPGRNLINNLYYPDNICLIALSSSGMQCLLNIM